MKKYCPQCKCERDVFFNSKEETYHIRESDITITAEIATCTICGEEIVDFEHDDATSARHMINTKLSMAC